MFTSIIVVDGVEFHAYPRNFVLIPLIAPVSWHDLPSRIDRLLWLFLKLDWELDSYGVDPTVMEPWTFWKGANSPTEEVTWNPVAWFQGEGDVEAFACTTLSNSLFGQVKLTLGYDRDNEVLSVMLEPTTTPLTPYETMLAIVVSTAIAQESKSFIRSKHGCCGPYEEMAHLQAWRLSECEAPHSQIDEAVQEVVVKLRHSFTKFGMEPLL